MQGGENENIRELSWKHGFKKCMRMFGGTGLWREEDKRCLKGAHTGPWLGNVFVGLAWG